VVNGPSAVVVRYKRPAVTKQEMTTRTWNTHEPEAMQPEHSQQVCWYPTGILPREQPDICHADVSASAGACG
jgi:hypothetical protein